LNPGDAYWLEDKNGVLHLHVALTHPEPDPLTNRNRVAVVNITTVRTKLFDNTTVLNSGDHPRITHQSYVRYQGANFEFVDDIEQKGKAVESFKTALFRKIFERIFEGKKLSPDVVREYCSNRIGPAFYEHGSIRNLYAESQQAANVNAKTADNPDVS
jgi:hypothetical protein